MSANSTSSNDSRLPQNHFTSGSRIQNCIITPPGSIIFTTFNITNVLLLLPLCIFILHHGLQLWRQKHSTSSAATVSHSDIFTYHMVVMELVGVVGCFLCFCGLYNNVFMVFSIGAHLIYFIWYGETFFHVLTCVERYLAVVHPITYLRLRNQRGIRIRNISIACVWLLCLVMMVLMIFLKYFRFVELFLLTMSLAVSSFCSLSVFRVLIRPGPGEQGGGRERVDQSKKKAFYTIMAILGVLVLRFAWILGWYILYIWGGGPGCVIIASAFLFSLPCSLVLPLLFLQRAGRLVCCKKNNE